MYFTALVSFCFVVGMWREFWDGDSSAVLHTQPAFAFLSQAEIEPKHF